jgi:hypothetical protein
VITIFDLVFDEVIIKRVCPTKIEPQQQGISYLKRLREGQGGRGAGLQVGILKLR